MVRLFNKVFKLIDQSWKMYPLGFLFGLGFDTSTEVALLGIAAIEAVAGTSIWLILLLPLLFTAGMCLVDTIDGALMSFAYSSTTLAADQEGRLFYSIVLTLVSIFAALSIGFIQMLSLVLNVAQPEGKFWDGVKAIGDHYDILGGAICGLFLVAGVASIFYRRYTLRSKRNAETVSSRLMEADIEDSVVTPTSAFDVYTTKDTLPALPPERAQECYDA